MCEKIVPARLEFLTDSQGPTGRRARASHSFVLVAVKAWQVPQTAEFIKPLAGSSTVILPLQNGVEATGQLAAVRGDDRVLAGFCRILSIIVEPGYTRHLGVDPCMVFGETARAPHRSGEEDCRGCSHPSASFHLQCDATNGESCPILIE